MLINKPLRTFHEPFESSQVLYDRLLHGGPRKTPSLRLLKRSEIDRAVGVRDVGGRISVRTQFFYPVTPNPSCLRVFNPGLLTVDGTLGTRKRPTVATETGVTPRRRMLRPPPPHVKGERSVAVSPPEPVSVTVTPSRRSTQGPETSTGTSETDQSETPEMRLSTLVTPSGGHRPRSRTDLGETPTENVEQHIGVYLGRSSEKFSLTIDR